MNFIQQKQEVLTLNQIFNEQHAALIIEQKLLQHPNFNSVNVNNVGIKIMKDAFQKFSEHPITRIRLYYNWNQIMLMPKLVCYDKNTWKTLQQLANWNRQWSLAFRNCFALRQFEADIVCSFADSEFVKSLLEGISALPNIQTVNIKLKSKNQKCGQMLQAFKSANIFPNFTYQFSIYKD